MTVCTGLGGGGEHPGGILTSVSGSRVRAKTTNSRSIYIFTFMSKLWRHLSSPGVMLQRGHRLTYRGTPSRSSYKVFVGNVKFVSVHHRVLSKQGVFSLK